VNIDTLLGDWLACDRFDVRDRLVAVKAPTLILTGALDVMTPPRAASFLAEHIAGADLTWLEGVGHMAPIEAPTLTAAAISGFLARLS
jgi:pimeloyl-ACP methyl ester carboxylesterase